MRQKILIDCDGREEHLPLILRACKEEQLDLRMVTSVFGERSSEETAASLEKELKKSNFSVPVVRGAEKAILQKSKEESGQKYPERKEAAEYAWDALYKEARKSGGQLVVLTWGALTNVAVALAKYEDLASCIQKIIMVGGSAECGDELPFGEGNVVRDPYACQMVFQSGIPVWMIGLDFERRVKSFSGEQAALLLAENPETAELHGYWGAVETAPGPMYGRTIFDRRLHSMEKENVYLVENLRKRSENR